MLPTRPRYASKRHPTTFRAIFSTRKCLRSAFNAAPTYLTPPSGLHRLGIPSDSRLRPTRKKQRQCRWGRGRSTCMMSKMRLTITYPNVASTLYSYILYMWGIMLPMPISAHKAHCPPSPLVVWSRWKNSLECHTNVPNY